MTGRVIISLQLEMQIETFFCYNREINSTSNKVQEILDVSLGQITVCGITSSKGLICLYHLINKCYQNIFQKYYVLHLYKQTCMNIFNL